MFFRDVANQPLDEINCRNGFLYVFVIFMVVVVERDMITIIFIDSWGGDRRACEIAPDIFDNCFGVTETGSGINVKAMFMVSVTFRFYILKGWSKDRFHFVQESCAESIAEKIGRKVVWQWRQNPSSLKPPSEIRQWIWGFHLRSLPKVCKTIRKPGVKFLDLFICWNMRKTTLLTEWNRQLSRERSLRKKSRRFLSMVGELNRRSLFVLSLRNCIPIKISL